MKTEALRILRTILVGLVLGCALTGILLRFSRTNPRLVEWTNALRTPREGETRRGPEGDGRGQQFERVDNRGVDRDGASPGPLDPEQAAAAGWSSYAGQEDAWAVLPVRSPIHLAIDSFDWAVLQDALCLASSLLLRRPCLDPGQVAAVLDHSTVVRARADPGMAAPSDGFLRQQAGVLRVRHLLIPGLAGERLLVWEAHESNSFKPVLVAEARLAADSAESVPEALRVALERYVTAGGVLRGKPAASGGLPLPAQSALQLLKKIPQSTRGLGGDALQPRHWRQLGGELALLGYVIQEGGSTRGRALLVRGVACSLVAALLSGNHVEDRLNRALGALLARHTAGAVATIQALPEKLATEQRALAGFIEAACRGEPAKIPVRPDTALLHCLALVRGSVSGELEAHAEQLVRAGLPLDFILTQNARTMELGTARSLVTQWAALLSDRELTDPAKLSAATLALVNGSNVSSWLPSMLARYACPHRVRKPEPLAPVSVETLLQEVEPATADVVALPGLEYASIAGTRWGAAGEAARVLEALDEAVPDSSALKDGWADHASEVPRSPASKRAREVADECARTRVRAQVIRLKLMEIVNRGQSRPQERDEQVMLLSDVDSSSRLLVWRRFTLCGSVFGARLVDPDHLRMELRRDPWDPDLWAVYLPWTPSLLPGKVLRSQIAEVQKNVPPGTSLVRRCSSLLAERGSPVEADRILEKALAMTPGNTFLWMSRVELLKKGLHLAKAARSVGTMLRASRDPLGDAAVMNALALACLRAGCLEAAQELVGPPLRIDSWREGTPSVAQLTRLMMAHRPKEALELLPEARRECAGSQPKLRRLALAVLAGGETGGGLQLLKEADAAAPGYLPVYEREMIRNPSLAGNPAVCKDVARMKAWLKTEISGRELVEGLSSNPSAEAVEALLWGVSEGAPLEAYQCAVALAHTAWLDVDLAGFPEKPDLQRAAGILKAWWSRSRASYPADRLPGQTGRATSR